MMIQTPRIFFILCLTVSVSSVFSQNLVPNSGFEEYAVCPGYYSQDPREFRVNAWTSASIGTPDHFHSCSNGEADVPHNWAGVSEAYEGSGYAGIYTWMNNDRNYREYLQCKLNTALIKDSTYIVEFHFRLSSYSMYAVDRIGLHFSDSLVRLKNDKALSIRPDILVLQDSALTWKTGLWELARQEYKARGGEQHVVIGNFFDDASTRYYHIQFSPEQQEMLKFSAYYYIDNVSVTPKYQPSALVAYDVPPDFHVESIEMDKTYVLKNIQFEFNSSRLSYASRESLDDLVLWLIQNPAVVLKLSGHTDDVGGDQYNLTLSLKRARSVAEYLIAKGILTERVSFAGYGKQKPLRQDTSDDARRINRRVEIKFAK
jgi:OmpA-OmpF porin, OOP family